MTGVDNWEMAKFIQSIGRSLRINPATGTELTAAQTFVTNIVAVRPWLYDTLNKIGANDGSNVDNVQMIGKKIYAIGRDMNKIPVQNNTEKGYFDTLITATGTRKWGDASTGPRGTISTSDVVNS